MRGATSNRDVVADESDGDGIAIGKGTRAVVVERHEARAEAKASRTTKLSRVHEAAKDEGDIGDGELVHDVTANPHALAKGVDGRSDASALLAPRASTFCSGLS